MSFIESKKIKKMYVIHHTHTDIGYTDFQDSVISYITRAIGQALDFCKQTEDYPDAAKMRWTCEVTYITDLFLQKATDKQVEQFLHYYKQGQIGVAGLPVHWTPLLSPSVAIRSMKTLSRIKKLGIDVDSAMQCDVNGLSWHWLDILKSLGINNFLMAPNPDRGMAARKEMTQRYFWWNTASKEKMLTLHGYHYSVGILQLYLTMNMQGSERRIQSYLSELEERGDYPFDFVMVPATEGSSCDNGGPLKELCDYVVEWNKLHPELPMELITLSNFFKIVQDEISTKKIKLPEYSGDWTDPWADGAASTAKETSLARVGERLIPTLELLSAFTNSQDEYFIDLAAENIALYDEHTWGACCSTWKPDSPYTEMQKQHKLSYARKGFTQTNELFSRLSRDFARNETKAQVENDLKFCHGFGGEGKFVDLPQVAGSVDEELFFVFNPTGYHQDIVWEHYKDISGAGPFYISHALLSNSYYPGMDLNSGFPSFISQDHVIKASLPPYSYQQVVPVPVDYSQAKYGENYMENQYYKVVFDIATGGIISLFDKEINKEIVDKEAAYKFGLILYEVVDSPLDRAAVFLPDWSDIRKMGFEYMKDKAPYEHFSADRVRMGSPRFLSTGIEVRGTFIFEGAMEVDVLYRLPYHQKGLYVELLVNKKEVRAPESVHVVFPLNMKEPKYYLDNGDQLIDPLKDKVPYSCVGWTACQQLVGASSKDFSVAIVPLDTPLTMFQGLTHRFPFDNSPYHDSLIAFWGMNNHWHTNFAISQTGICPMRYWITSESQWDEYQMRSFANNCSQVPVISRIYNTPRKESAVKTLISIEGGKNISHTIRKGDKDNAAIIRIVEHADQKTEVSVSWKTKIKSAEFCNALGESLDHMLSVQGNHLKFTINPKSVVYIKINEEV